MVDDAFFLMKTISLPVCDSTSLSHMSMFVFNVTMSFSWYLSNLAASVTTLALGVIGWRNGAVDVPSWFQKCLI